MKRTKGGESISLEKLSSNAIPENVVADRTDDIRILFEDKLKCMLWVENHLLIALPKMISAAGDENLKNTFAEHLKVTAIHVARLEKVFDLLGQVPLPKKSNALEGLTIDGENLIEETVANSDARITGLIMAGQLVENYEMKSYEGLIQLATQLGLDEISALLEETRREEEEADSRLEALKSAQ